MSKAFFYICSICNERYEVQDVIYLCPNDQGVLNVEMDWSSIAEKIKPKDIQQSRNESIWRYLPLLPVRNPGHKNTALSSVGWTPVYQTKRLGEKSGLQNLWIKDESLNPSASFKDRASALLVVRAQEINAEVIVTASTGNAGAALACMAAASGMRAVIFAPKSAPPAKIAQLLVFGAQVFLIDGSYDDAAALSIEASQEFNWYSRNTGYNPFTAEGKKTAAFEIWEQILTHVSMDKPLSIFVSVGDGNIISGIHKGFRDLISLGWIKESPRIFGVQAEGSAAIADAFDANTEVIQAVNANTLADSISVNFPADGLRALRAATQTGGAYITVNDKDILEAIPLLGTEAIFAEPAGAAAFAGAKAALKSGLIKKDDPILVINTGSGLKDVSAAIKVVGEAPIIAANLAALKKVMAL